MKWIDHFVEMLFPVDGKNVDFEGAYLLKDKHMPESLFKYRRVDDYAIKNLEEDFVWLADPVEFNDPYDCAHALDMEFLGKRLMPEFFKSNDCGIELNEELLKEIISSEDPFLRWMDHTLREEPEERRAPLQSQLAAMFIKMRDDLAMYHSQRFAGNFKVCSFSEINDSLLMWAHYADYHKGFCLEYDTKSMPYSDPRRRFMYPVIYSDNMFDATNYMLNDKDGRNVLHLNLAALTKAIDWQYEREWRLVFSNGVLPEPQVCYMGKPKHLYLGAKMVKEDQEKLLDICRRKKISYTKMKPHPHKFKVEPVSLGEAKNFLLRDGA